jgi:16S rRNA (guanine527-N7)-methyltransferase
MNRFDLLAAFCSEQGFTLSTQARERFASFEDDLYASNLVMNLTRVDRAECELRHIIDSLLVASLLPNRARLIDIGTGPGFPAWPLACVRPDLSVVALDSSGKMLDFLRRHPLPNLEIRQGRAEEDVVVEEFDAATGRALAPLAAQLELSAPRVRIGGLVVPFRTPNDLTAIEAFPAGRLGLRLQEIVTKPLPGTEIVRVFPVFAKVSRTPPEFPRSWPTIRRLPIAG